METYVSNRDGLKIPWLKDKMVFSVISDGSKFPSLKTKIALYSFMVISNRNICPSLNSDEVKIPSLITREGIKRLFIFQ